MEHIYNLMRQDSYRRFVESKQFKQLRQIEVARHITENHINEAFQTEKRTTNEKAEQSKFPKKRGVFQRIKTGIRPRVSSHYTQELIISNMLSLRVEKMQNFMTNRIWGSTTRLEDRKYARCFLILIKFPTSLINELKSFDVCPVYQP